MIESAKGGETMGILDRIMRGKAKGQGNVCYKCNEPVVVNNIRVPVTTLDISTFINPPGGYCRGCQHYVCSEHTIWVNTEKFTYLSGCPKCKRELAT